MMQMTVLAYAFASIVPAEKRGAVVARLDALESRAARNAGWYAGNNVVESSYRFLSRAFDGFLR